MAIATPIALAIGSAVTILGEPGGLVRETVGGLRMQIGLVAAVGRGRTLLSAFDAALNECGAANYNLIALSSVIPPQSEVKPRQRIQAAGDQHGWRLYVVKADARSDRVGACLGAGVGWYQWGDGRGVFVEHETVAPTEEEAERRLRCLVHDSLRDLCAFRGIPFCDDKIGSRITVARVEDQPTCALVLAVYAAEPWEDR
jgi:arginine decarboxylase